LGFAGIALAAGERGLPRYKLQVGQELRYRGQDEFKYERGKYGTRDSWSVWVVRQNPDGSWRLLVRYGNEFAMAREPLGAAKIDVDDKPKEDSKADANGTPEKEAPAKELPLDFTGDETVTFAWCDITPEGRIAPNDSFGFRMRLEGLLPKLPQTDAEVASGWRVKDERMDEEYVFTRGKGTAEGAFDIQMIVESPMVKIYGMERSSVVSFDIARGIPTLIESRTAQTYGFKGNGAGTTTLAENSVKSPEWCEKFLADAEMYFAAMKAYESALDDTSKPLEDYKQACEATRTQFASVADRIESEELKGIIKKKLDDEKQMEKYRIDSVTDRLAVLGMASEEWATTDISGQPVGLKDLQGKVVVLDFWYRGCGWCIRAMPQMKQIAAHFDGKPVAVLGMNTDREEADAKFVIDAMQLNYNTLKATGLPEKYKVKGFPTLVILDRKGVVRDVHVGYSPTLRKAVVESVEKLLAEKDEQPSIRSAL
jgi:thiol-disulfide isomerase/thioredoxin